MTSISRDQALLVILDDIHVADEPSLLMLRFLAEAVSQERILVLASYRDAERGVHEQARHSLSWHGWEAGSRYGD